MTLTQPGDRLAGHSGPASLVAYELAISGKPREEARSTLERLFGATAAEAALREVYPEESRRARGLRRLRR